MVRRDGGKDSGGWYGDGDVYPPCADFPGDNCSSFCSVRGSYNTMHCSGSYDTWPYYLKCYDALTSKPQNDIRMQFASQAGTTGIDTTIPQISIGNISFCLRMRLLL